MPALAIINKPIGEKFENGLTTSEMNTFLQNVIRTNATLLPLFPLVLHSQEHPDLSMYEPFQINNILEITFTVYSDCEFSRDISIFSIEKVKHFVEHSSLIALQGYIIKSHRVDIKLFIKDPLALLVFIKCLFLTINNILLPARDRISFVTCIQGQITKGEMNLLTGDMNGEPTAMINFIGSLAESLALSHTFNPENNEICLKGKS